MIPWLEVFGLAAALALIGSFFWSEWHEERQLQLRREVQLRQRREAWERHLKATCAHLARERRSRRHARWME